MSSQDDSIIVDTIETENENLYSQECDDTTKTKRIKIKDSFFQESGIIEIEDDI